MSRGPGDAEAARRFITAMPPSSDDNHRVASFPCAKVRKLPGREATHHGDPSLLLSLAKFERDDREDDHRNRIS
jgi:hypothetical protein